MRIFKKIHHFLFYLLILLLPVQLGKHFWPNWALVGGIRIDYLTPVIYLTDLLVVGILVVWGAESLVKIKNQKSKIKITNQNVKIFLFLFVFLILNILFSQNKAVAFLKCLKIAELVLLAIYVKNNLTIQPYNHLTILLSFTVIYSSLIAWAQFLKQASIGGLFWWLGERTFVSSTPGIAQVVLGGRLFLRPYATFPHPNVLGGYLATATPLLITQISNLKCQNHNLNLKTILNILAVVLGAATLFITFSRSGWVVGGIGIAAAFFLSYLKTHKKRAKKKKPTWLHGYMVTWLILATILVFLCFYVFMLFGQERMGQLKFDSESFQIRSELNKVALAMIKKHSLTGAGLNNFIVSLPQFKKGLSFKELQPVHNIYLLIGAESGLIGLGLFLWLIYLSYRKLLFSHLTIALTTILLLGFFDHYFFTLQQTQLLFVIVLGMVLGYDKINESNRPN